MKSSSMIFSTYVSRLLTEKGISTEYTLEIPSDGLFGNHFVPLSVVIEFIESLDVQTQHHIKETLIRIDFSNGNILHYLEFLTKGMVKVQFTQ